jgi:hypothetical protein
MGFPLEPTERELVLPVVTERPYWIYAFQGWPQIAVRPSVSGPFTPGSEGNAITIDVDVLQAVEEPTEPPPPSEPVERDETQAAADILRTLGYGDGDDEPEEDLPERTVDLVLDGFDPALACGTMALYLVDEAEPDEWHATGTELCAGAATVRRFRFSAPAGRYRVGCRSVLYRLDPITIEVRDEEPVQVFSARIR